MLNFLALPFFSYSIVNIFVWFVWFVSRWLYRHTAVFTMVGIIRAHGFITATMYQIIPRWRLTMKNRNKLRSSCARGKRKLFFNNLNLM
jgi:hypothetical protein